MVTTLYQSSPYLEEFHRRVSAQARALVGESYELVFVNDGSPDDSLELALGLHRDDPHVRVLDLSRNFGHHRAIMTGLATARGALVFLIDCDLEEQPEDLSRFHAELTRTAADVVFGVREKREGAMFERLSGSAFYRVFNLLSPQPVVPDQVDRPADDAALRRGARRAPRARDLPRRPVRPSRLRASGSVAVQKASKGQTTYTLDRRIAAFVNAVTSFSARPLVYVFYLGCFILAGLGARRRSRSSSDALFFGLLFPGLALTHRRRVLFRRPHRVLPRA